MWERWLQESLVCEIWIIQMFVLVDTFAGVQCLLLRSLFLILCMSLMLVVEKIVFIKWFDNFQEFVISYTEISAYLVTHKYRYWVYHLDDWSSQLCFLTNINYIMRIIIIVITLKGAIRDFYNLLTALWTVSNMCAQVTKSRAAHWVLIACSMLCATWYEGTAQLFSLTELKSLLF